MECALCWTSYFGFLLWSPMSSLLLLFGVALFVNPSLRKLLFAPEIENFVATGTTGGKMQFSA